MEPKEVKKRFIASMTSVGLAYELLDRGASDLAQSLVQLERGELGEVHSLLIDAQDIFSALREMLREDDPETLRTAALFDLILQHLCYANLHKDRERLEELNQIVGRLRTHYLANWGEQQPNH